jgi:hypothetical protein
VINLGLDMSGVKRPILGQMRRHMKTLMHELGRQWHRFHLPRHFTRTAVQEYGLDPRHPDYLERKRRQKKSLAANVLSGKTRRYTKYGERITATSKQVTIRFNVPRGRHRRINKELTAVNHRDKSHMQTTLLQGMQQKLGQLLKGQ